MAKAISGKTFSSGEEVTATKLHNIVDNATINAVDKDDLAAGADLVIPSATAPTDTTLIWFDTTLSVVRIYDGTNWVPTEGIILTNNSGGQVTAGQVCTVDITQDSSFVLSTTANDAFAGVAAETIEDGSSGVLWSHGVHLVKVSGISSGGQAGSFGSIDNVEAGAVQMFSTPSGDNTVAMALQNTTAGETSLFCIFGQNARLDP